MLSFTSNKSECTGCSACMAACPVNCIRMETDKEGFWYPVSSDLCINCGKCERVCPVTKHEKTANYNEQHAYACVTKNSDIWRRSASGGGFSEICLAWGDDKTIVVGAAWDGLQVHHVCIEGVQNTASICKSKYIASFPENTFADIKSFLKEGRKVIFCGTPCQVAGLKSFLNKDYENLLTIDLICHGVGSPLVFMYAIKTIEDQYGMSVASYEFRAKRSCYEKDYITSIEDGTKKIYLENDQYIQMFLKQLCLRPSCSNNCVFRDSNRQGDITIADFKGLELIYPELKNAKKNYTAVITNSAKGECIVDKLKKTAIVKQATIENIKEYNPLFYRHTWYSAERDDFFKSFIKDPASTIQNWTTDSIRNRLTVKKKIRSMVPKVIINFLMRISS